MKKQVCFEFEGKRYEVTVERKGDRLEITHEGKSHVVTLLPARPATAAAEGPQPGGPSVRSELPAASSRVAPAPVQPPPTSSPAAEVDSSGALHAPMTGVIKEIKAGVGHNVEAGQVVLVMEAMKMDIDVPSPVSGVVAEVSVRPGDNVNANQQLMIIHWRA
jgi:biotin carboxyl carrier protein